MIRVPRGIFKRTHFIAQFVCILLFLSSPYSASAASETFGHYSKNHADPNKSSGSDPVFDINKNLPLITLPALKPEEKLSADTSTDEIAPKGPEVIGLWQDFESAVELNEMESTHGVWEYQADYSKNWGLSIHAKDAVGIRVQILDAKLPSSAQIYIYNSKNPTEFHGPITNEQLFYGELWLPTCFGDTVTLECHVPAESQFETLSLRIERISHIYKNPTIVEKNAGACNLDSTCYPDWQDAANGVCGIGSIAFGVSLFCTGSLLADNDPCTDIPYLLTANHCVSGTAGGTGANSVEAYWFYQTPTCDGTAPILTTVPRTTGGADLLAGVGGRGDTGGGNDFTLLRLRNQPPALAYFNGWTTAGVPTGTLISGIHHPSGDFKRIAFGYTLENINFNPQDYHANTWSSGTTEPGSSGSPLFLDSTQQIIGQLWGGNASCSNLTGADLYGRFDVTYPIIQQWIDSGPAQFSVPETFTIVEGQSLNIPINLPWESNGSGAQVDFILVPASALAGSDYVHQAGTRIFGAGQKIRNVLLQTVNDTATEPDETLFLILQNPQCGILSPTVYSCEITIADDDPDTDGDGISDVDELSGAMGWVTDPNLYDTDGDGLSDWQEQTNYGGHITDPTNPDTDEDGYSDLTEINFGMNPLVPDLPGLLNSLVVPFFKK